MSFLANHHQEPQLWGSEEIFTVNEASTVKIMRVNASARFSLQKHAHRSEYWKVIDGDGLLHLGNEERPVKVGDEIEVPPETLHRLTGGNEGITVLEISEGHYDKGDIVRLEDDYGRA